MTAASKKLATAADLLPYEKGMEVVDGELMPKAAPSFEHGDAQSSISELLKPAFQRGRGGPGGWWIASEVEVELAAHQVFLPDVVGWRKERVPDRPRGRPIRVRPDWVCEVLSPSNAKRDLGPKLNAYHRAEVPHYWVIDTEHETLIVYRVTSEGYVVALTAGRSDIVRAEPFDAIEIRVGDLFGQS